ncbi:MAG: hypothetical protein AAF383_14185 [Cyanobacteria bacterium P01_A01_bin.83]
MKNFNHQRFWNATPKIVDIAIAGVLISLGAGLGWAIAKSQKVEVTQQGILIEQQAIANHKDLERSLLMNKIQQGLIERYEADAKEFARRYEAGAELAEQAQFAAKVIPPQQIEELENNVRESQQVLDEAKNY